jgi:hypothetical protein
MVIDAPAGETVTDGLGEEVSPPAPSAPPAPPVATTPAVPTAPPPAPAPAAEVPAAPAITDPSDEDDPPEPPSESEAMVPETAQIPEAEEAEDAEDAEDTGEASPRNLTPATEPVNLQPWKLQLPVGEAESPDEIEQPALNEYQSDWFAKEDSGALRFRAPVNGVTTSGSDNPRSELREMSADGQDEAKWSTSEGTHALEITQAITRLPEGNPRVVAGQVHGEDDDLSVFRLEGSSLYVTKGNDPKYRLITSDYVLGTPFQAKFEVGGGEIKAYYNGELKATIEQEPDTAYFKAGAYTQANCDNTESCTEDNYGEVKIYELKVSHQD